MSVSEQDNDIDTAPASGSETEASGESPLSERRVRIGATAALVAVTVAAIAVGGWWLSGPPNEPPPPEPLTRSEVEQIAARSANERANAVRGELTALDERLKDVTEQVNVRGDELAGVRQRVRELDGAVAEVRGAEPWRAALERAREEWGGERASLIRRLDHLERRVRAQAEQTHQQRERAEAGAVAAAREPAFRVTGIEYWGPALYATTRTGEAAPERVRQGDARGGWRFVGLGARAERAIFTRGEETRQLPVMR